MSNSTARWPFIGAVFANDFSHTRPGFGERTQAACGIRQLEAGSFETGSLHRTRNKKAGPAGPAFAIERTLT
jgi:hypothetical protein